MKERIEVTQKNLLDSYDWGEENYKKYIAYGITIWNTYKLLNNRVILNANIIEDIVQTTIMKLFSGDRVWDFEKVPIEAWIKMTIRSEISNLYNKKSSKDEDNFSDDDYDSLEFNTYDYDNNNTLRSTDPLEILVVKENYQELANNLLKIVSGDDLLEKIIYALLEGIENKPRELAAYLDVPINEIYNANKRFCRLMADFNTTNGSE